MNRNGWLRLAPLLAITLAPHAEAAKRFPPTVLARVDSLHAGLFKTDERVRITMIPSGAIRTGHLAWYSADTVALRDDKARLSTGSIRTIERSVNRHSTAGRGAGIGALLGAASLAATAGAAGATDDPDFAAIAVGASLIGGALIGAGIGAIVGATIHTEDWIPVATQVPTARVGDRVRLEGPLIPDEKVVGTLAERTTDTLYVMRDDARVAVPLMPPLSMEVSLGKAPHGSNTAKVLCGLGLIAGAVAGGYFLGHDTEGWGYPSAILTGGAVGAAGGWFLGKTMSGYGDEERWGAVEAR